MQKIVAKLAKEDNSHSSGIFPYSSGTQPPVLITDYIQILILHTYTVHSITAPYSHLTEIVIYYDSKCTLFRNFLYYLLHCVHVVPTQHYHVRT